MDQQQALAQLATQMRSIAAGIVQASSGPGDGQQLNKLTTEGLLHILRLKEAARLVVGETESSKEATQAAKVSLDSSDTTLQNLLYEKSYYEKEIHNCRSFVSKYSDEEVALMPVADFLASQTDAPEDQLLRKAASANEHELMKTRLIHEDRVRKALIKQLEELKRQKQTLQEHVSQRQRTVSDLQVKLKTVESSARPLQQVLGPSVPLKGSMSRAAELLPTPLYIAYSQIMAAREALQHGCNASIVGSVDQAEAYAQALGDGGDDSHLLLLRTSAAGTAPPEEIYKAHPLSVELQVHRDATLVSGGKPPSVVLTVTFQYLPALRVVTAHCSNSADNVLLKSLFPRDDGSGMPIECLQQLQGGTFKYSSTRPARPFRWCQDLCGLDFVPPLPQLAVQLSSKDQETVVAGLDSYRRQQRVPNVLVRLRQAKLWEGSLNSIHSVIPQNKVPPDAGYTSYPRSVVMVWEQQSVDTHEMVPASPHPAHTRKTANKQQQKDRTAAEVTKEPALREGELDDGELPAEHEDGVVAGGATEEGQQPAGPKPAGMDVDGEELEPSSWGALLEEEEAVRSPTPQAAAGEDVRARPNDLRAQRSAAAAQLLLGDADDDTETANAVQPKVRPICQTYRLVARSAVLELEATVQVYLEYPLRPPLFRVQALRTLPPAAADALAATSRGGPAATRAFYAIPAHDALGEEAANSIAWLEHQVNVYVLDLLKSKTFTNMLLYQVVHLRMCLDALSKQQEMNGYLKPGASSKAADARDVALLHARQQLISVLRTPPSLEQVQVPPK